VIRLSQLFIALFSAVWVVQYACILSLHSSRLSLAGSATANSIVWSRCTHIELRWQLRPARFRQVIDLCILHRFAASTVRIILCSRTVHGYVMSPTINGLLCQRVCQ
jgi:hypothetical protein